MNFFGFQRLYAWSLLLMSLFLKPGQAQSIEGFWKYEDQGVLIEIYIEDGLYYGKLVGSDDSKRNAKIKEQDDPIILLQSYKKRDDEWYCCGKIYQPKMDRLVDGDLKLLNANTLKVTGRLGSFSRSQKWIRQM